MTRLEFTPPDVAAQPAFPRGLEIEPRRIVIVGGGASGTMLAIHLLRTAREPTLVQLVEREAECGLGVAYRTPEQVHVLNVPAGRMSALPGDPDHFVRWLRTLPDVDTLHVTRDSFVPRRLFGQYLQRTLQEAVARRMPHVHLSQVRAEAVDLEPHAGRWRVRLASGDTLDADRVVLALGNFPPRPPRLADGSRLPDAFLVSNPWRPDALRRLDPDAPLLLLGTGLTMVDVALALRARGHAGHLHGVSRRGLLPQEHASGPTYPDFLHAHPFPLTASGLLRRVREEIELAATAGIGWRSVIDAMRPSTRAVWQALPLGEQERFIRHLQPYWDTHRHRLAPKVAGHLRGLLASGQLDITAGRLLSAEPDGDALRITVRRRDDTLRPLRVAGVLNCTGPACHVRELASPLVRAVLARGIGRPDDLGMGLDVSPAGELRPRDGTERALHHGVYALGSLTRGSFWETTAVPELSRQTAWLAGNLLG